MKWQIRKFSVLFDPNFWYFNVTDFLSQMSASLLFFLLLSQQAYKYFQWNFTKWHILHFVNHIHTNSSLVPLPGSVSGPSASASLTPDLTQMPRPQAPPRAGEAEGQVRKNQASPCKVGTSRMILTKVTNLTSLGHGESIPNHHPLLWHPSAWLGTREGSCS